MKELSQQVFQAWPWPYKLNDIIKVDDFGTVEGYQGALVGAKFAQLISRNTFESCFVT